MLPLDRIARGLAIGMALLGGAALIGVVLVSCVSILGRAGGSLGLGLTSLRGDTEWVEFGTGFAVFAFLPWCTYMRGHASVDLLRPLFGTMGNRVLDLVAELLIFGLAVLVTWRMWAGMLDKRAYHETTFILRAPVWEGYAASMLGAAAFVLVSGYCVARAARALAWRG